MTNAKYYTPVI